MIDKIIEELKDLYIDIVTEGDISLINSHNNAIDKVIEIVNKHQNDGWVDVSERLPKCEEEVQITTRRKYKDEYHYIVTNAFYEDGTMLENDSDWNWNECNFEKYDDEEDCYIIDEGWWEYKHYNADDVYNNAVDDEVIAWKPLSNPYIIK